MSLVRIVAAVFGVVYLVAGIGAFFLVSGGEGELVGLFEVNALHNVVHIVLGAILLYGMMSTSAAILTTRAVGAILVLIGVAGFAFPDLFGLMPIDGNDIWLHLGSGAILLAVGFLATGD